MAAPPATIGTSTLGLVFCPGFCLGAPITIKATPAITGIAESNARRGLYLGVVAKERNDVGTLKFLKFVAIFICTGKLFSLEVSIKKKFGLFTTELQRRCHLFRRKYYGISYKFEGIPAVCGTERKFVKVCPLCRSHSLFKINVAFSKSRLPIRYRRLSSSRRCSSATSFAILVL